MKKVNMKFQYPIKFQINKTNHYIRIGHIRDAGVQETVIVI